jgi:hypothetical protein
VARLWDGHGFRDKAFNGRYEVYKCALFIYVYRALKYAGSSTISQYRDIYESCLNVLKMAQDPIYGGLHTEYVIKDGKTVIMGDVNVETTSIAVLALYSACPEIIGYRARGAAKGITSPTVAAVG